MATMKKKATFLHQSCSMLFTKSFARAANLEIATTVVQLHGKTRASSTS